MDNNSTDSISYNNTDNISNTDVITEKKSEEKIDPIIPHTPSYPTANVFLLWFANIHISEQLKYVILSLFGMY